MKESTLEKLEYIGRASGRNAIQATYAKRDIKEKGPGAHDLAREFTAAAAADLEGYIRENRACSELANILRFGDEGEMVAGFLETAQSRGVDYRGRDVKQIFQRFADDMMTMFTREFPDTTAEEIAGARDMYMLNAAELSEVTEQLASSGFGMAGTTIASTPVRDKPVRRVNFGISVRK